jgi:hypothetical protein
MAIEHLIMLIDAHTLANLGMSAKLYFGMTRPSDLKAYKSYHRYFYLLPFR